MSRAPELIEGLPPVPDDDTVVVHVVRHGLVHNPTGILYGTLPDFHLSDHGRAMADRVAQSLSARPVRRIVTSPLERAQETAAPVAARLGLDAVIDERLLESASVFEGRRVSVGDGSLRDPRSWRHLWNPFRPSWGEAYRSIAVRMLGAVADARDAVAGGQEAVCVSHQLPIVTVRRFLLGQRLWHDPRHRNCSVASISSFSFHGSDLVAVHYAQPAADLVAAATGGQEPQAGA